MILHTDMTQINYTSVQPPLMLNYCRVWSNIRLDFLVSPEQSSTTLYYMAVY